MRRFSSATGQCEPAGCGIPGDAFDASDRRLPHAVHTHARDFIEKSPGLVQAVVWATRGRAEGTAAPGAAVTAAPALRGTIEGVAYDVALSETGMEWAMTVRAAAVFEMMKTHDTCSGL